MPLLISHPSSPYKGQHYRHPVELLDIYPTLNDILSAPQFDRKKDCPPGQLCLPLSGKSLAPVILGPSEISKPKHDEKKKKKTDLFGLGFGSSGRRLEAAFLNISTVDPLEPAFAISQNFRCADKLRVMEEMSNIKNSIPNQQKLIRNAIWTDCDTGKSPPNEISILAYSVRTLHYRYTSWFFFNRKEMVPILDVPPFAEELYDHRHEQVRDLGHLEIVNLANKKGYENTLLTHREKLIEFIRKKIIFRGKK